MDRQAKTHDLGLRVPVEPFTETGHIAARYNQAIAAFEARHHQSVKDLAEIYYLTTAISAALEHDTFDVHRLDLEEVMGRRDEIGALARTIAQMGKAIYQRDRELANLKQRITRAEGNAPS